MQATALLQNTGWHFDLQSAVIGAVVAWVIALALYLNRGALKRLAERLWSPVTKWQSKAQRSTGEKYVNALQEALRSLLLFAPQHPDQVFVPPVFFTAAPLPANAAIAGGDRQQRVGFSQLSGGHPRVLITGSRGSGRTTALVMSVWHAVETGENAQQPYTRLPVWIDLSHVDSLPSSRTPPDQFITGLAATFLPEVLPKWLKSQLKNQTSLILVDNWDEVPVALRADLAGWITRAAESWPESLWIIATGPAGYGPLVEAGFVPAEIEPDLSQNALHKLHNGWARELNLEPPKLRGEALYTMLWAIEAGDTLPELVLRLHLHLETEETPYRPTDVLTALLHRYLQPTDLDEELALLATHAVEIAITLLSQIARATQLEKRAVTGADVNTMLAANLPPEETRPPKLEGLVRRIVQTTPLIKRGGKTVRFSADIWEDFLTAWALAAETRAAGLQPTLLLEHLHDPGWQFLLNCYVGLGEAEDLVKARLREGLGTEPTLPSDGIKPLLQVALWAMRAPEDVSWRPHVMKALAQAFVAPEIAEVERLTLGRALSLVAGENAHPFYLKMLRHPSHSVRATALRGLGWTGTARDMNILAAALKDKNPEIVKNALRALGDLRTPGAIRFLSEILPRVDQETMLVICEVLAANPESWDTLKAAQHADDLLVRRAVAHGLAGLHQPWAREILEQMAFDDPQWLVRSAAEAALATQETETGVIPSPPQLDSLEWLMEWAAQQGLGLGLGEAALQMLLHAVEAGETSIRIWGANTLKRIGKPEHLDVLRPLLNDSTPETRHAAREAIRHIERRYLGAT